MGTERKGRIMQERMSPRDALNHELEAWGANTDPKAENSIRIEGNPPGTLYLTATGQPIGEITALALKPGEDYNRDTEPIHATWCRPAEINLELTKESADLIRQWAGEINTTLNTVSEAIIQLTACIRQGIAIPISEIVDALQDIMRNKTFVKIGKRFYLYEMKAAARAKYNARMAARKPKTRKQRRR